MKKLLLSLSLAVGSIFGVLADTATVTYSEVFSDVTGSSSKDVTSESTKVPNSEITITYSKGTNNSNAPKYYANGTALRFYQNNTLTFTIPTGCSISKIVMNAPSGQTITGSTNVGTFSRDGTVSTWTAPEGENITSVVFTASATGRCNDIVFTYTAPVGMPVYDGYDSQYTLEIGQTLNIPSITPSDLTYTFTTEDNNIISIENGVITALATGTATVKFSTEAVEDKFLAGEGEFTVNVTKIAPELSFRDQVVYGKLGVGVVWELVNVITPEDSDLRGDITYFSSNPEIVTIDATTGQIHPEDIKAAGEVTITATMAAKGDYAEGSADYKIIVIDPNAAIEPTSEQFDFTVENPYGMTTQSGGNTYETKVTEIASESGVVSIAFSGNYRSWTLTNSYELRLQKSSSMEISVPEGYKISKIGLVATDDKGSKVSGTYEPASGTAIPDGEAGDDTGVDTPNSTWIPATTEAVTSVTYKTGSSTTTNISKIYVLYEAANSTLKTADLSFTKVVNNLYVDEVTTINAVNNPFNREIKYSIDNLSEDKYHIEPSADGKTIDVLVEEAGYFTLRATSKGDSEYRDGLAIMRINVYRHLEVFANNTMLTENEIPTGEDVTITMTVPEHAYLYYQIQTDTDANTPAPTADGTEDENQLPGYEIYEDGIEIPAGTDGKLNFYIANYGYISPIRSITLGQGLSTSIATIEAQAGAKAVYDLMGRKVEKPAHGLYIIGGQKVRL